MTTEPVGERHDVVVIGAGAAGLATARELARGGYRPLVLDRFAAGHTRGSSHGRSRIVRLTHVRDDDTADAVAAMDRWRRLERDTGTVLRAGVGGLTFGAHVDPIAGALDRAGLAHEVLDPTQVQQRFPGVRALGQRAVYQGDTAVGLADVVLATLARDALAHGAVLREGVAVHRLEPGRDGITVHTGGPGGTARMIARAVVLAAGAWTPQVAATAGVDVAGRATLQSPVHLRRRDPGPPPPVVIDVAADGEGCYAMPEPGIDGGPSTMIKGGIHQAGPPADLAGARAPDPGGVAEFVRWARHRFADLDPVPVHTAGCLYTWLPDSRFHLARHGRLVVVSCCSGRGFKFTPLTGSRAAALAAEVLSDDGVSGRVGPG